MRALLDFNGQQLQPYHEFIDVKLVAINTLH
jgi:hypothetical protein